ncbi:MAG: phosphate ABC transporter substrate-binding protein PstS [Acidobacteriota bacterium]|nr:phosphate ABC transporter substrate-binding protein PstS [Acidobacteriota bacterium]
MHIKRMICLGAAVFGVSATGAVASASASTIKEAGSSLVFPLVSIWSQHYSAATVSPAAGGSGVGIKDISANSFSVDIGASDAPMSAQQYAGDSHDPVEIPWALTATGVGYNIPGVKGLRLSATLLAQIYTGKITTWGNKAILKINKSHAKALRRAGKITPVFRSDGSGDSFAFQNFLFRGAPKLWKTVPSTSFPTTVGQGENGNAGVAGEVRQNKGTIGYISAAYLIQQHISTAAIQNAAKNFEYPNGVNIANASASNSKIPAQGTAFTNANGVPIQYPSKKYKIAYPISTYSYAIVNRSPVSGGASSGDRKAFLSWAVTSGQHLGGALDFVALPRSIVSQDQGLINSL